MVFRVTELAERCRFEYLSVAEFSSRGSAGNWSWFHRYNPLGAFVSTSGSHIMIYKRYPCVRSFSSYMERPSEMKSFMLTECDVILGFKSRELPL